MQPAQSFSLQGGVLGCFSLAALGAPLGVMFGLGDAAPIAALLALAHAKPKPKRGAPELMQRARGARRLRQTDRRLDDAVAEAQHPVP